MGGGSVHARGGKAARGVDGDDGGGCSGLLQKWALFKCCAPAPPGALSAHTHLCTTRLLNSSTSPARISTVTAASARLVGSGGAPLACGSRLEAVCASSSWRYQVLRHAQVWSAVRPVRWVRGTTCMQPCWAVTSSKGIQAVSCRVWRLSAALYLQAPHRGHERDRQGWTEGAGHSKHVQC